MPQPFTGLETSWQQNSGSISTFRPCDLRCPVSDARSPSEFISSSETAQIQACNENRSAELADSTSHSTISTRMGSSRLLSGSPLATRPKESLHVPDDDMPTQAEISDCSSETIMAVDMQIGGTLGCCYYVGSEEKMYLLNDMRCGDIEIIHTLKLAIQPTRILLSPRIDKSIDDALGTDQSGARSNSGYEGAYRLPYATEVLTGGEFDYSSGKLQLCQCAALLLEKSDATIVTSCDDPTTPEAAGQMLVLANMIDLQCSCSIACASAVFYYMQRRRNQILSSLDPRAACIFRVMSLQMFSPDDVVYINVDTLTALQVVAAESHPDMQNHRPSHDAVKESLSVYGIFSHFAKTPQGKRKLRQAFIRPSNDLTKIAQRHSSVRTFAHNKNFHTSEAVTKSLKSIKNLRPLLVHLRRGMNRSSGGTNEVRCGIWTALRAFAFHILEIHRNIKELHCDQALDIVSEILNLDVRTVAIIGHEITNTVDFGTSAEEGRAIVRPGVNEGLDSLKRTYAGIDSLLSRLSSEIIKDFRDCTADFYLNVVTYPQIGFLIAVQRDTITGGFPNPPYVSGGNFWNRVFCTEEVTYYKDSRMRALDWRYGDLAGHIYDKEIEITFKLGQRILAHNELLCRVSDICGELDLILALAQGARLYNLIQPAMTTDNVIDIKGGRHILKERFIPSFIPNDMYIQRAHVEESPDSQFKSLELLSESSIAQGPNIVIVTGPNSSGKSTILRQVALIVLLAHAGSFVPAESATIGITDKILTRISTCETISRRQSAFMIDVQQVASLIRLATSRSLCIIDEFGKGTDARNGAALACAIFEHFLERNCNRTRVLATTHFHEIFEIGPLCSTPKLALFHLDVVLDESAAIGARVLHLYKLRPGPSGSSLGLDCAALHGVPAHVIRRAKVLIHLQERGSLLEPCHELKVREAQTLELAESIGRAFAEWDTESKVCRTYQSHRGFLQGILSRVSVGSEKSATFNTS